MALRVPAAIMLTPVIALFARRTGTRLTDFMPVLAVGAIAPRPLLIIHGDDDSTVPLHHALMLYEAAKQPKELWRLPGVGHVGAYFADRRAYVERITTFFLEALVRGRARRAAG